MSNNDKREFGACSTGHAINYQIAPEPLYETRTINKEPIVATPVNDNNVEVMSLLDHDPNTPHIDADRYTEEQRFVQELAIRTDARFASFMDNCRQLRESDPAERAAALDKFTDRLVDLYLEGRAPLSSTEHHRTMMRLVLKSTLANLISSPD